MSPAYRVPTGRTRVYQPFLTTRDVPDGSVAISVGDRITRLRPSAYGMPHQARRTLVNSGTLPFRIPARSLRYTEEKKNAPNGIYGTSRNA
jgi:hypothetical protein